MQAIKDLGGLNGYLDKSNKQIEEIVNLVRGKLTTMARISLEALIVIDVHGWWPFILLTKTPFIPTS